MKNKMMLQSTDVKTLDNQITKIVKVANPDRIEVNPTVKTPENGSLHTRTLFWENEIDKKVIQELNKLTTPHIVQISFFQE